MILKDLNLIEDRDARLAFIKAHTAEIIKAKRSELKTSAPLIFSPSPIYREGITKASPTEQKAKGLKGFEVVANSCGFLDHHGDVSMPGSFTKTAAEGAKRASVLKDHQHNTDGIIAKNLGVSIKGVSVRELGYDKDGEAECIVFRIDPVYDERVKMLYINNEIKEHSIGLQYVKLVACINDKDDQECYDNWQKYIDFVINKEEAIEQGYFFAVLEQKVFEVSAVLFGSNKYTPPLNKSLNSNEPSDDTQEDKEPINGQGKSLVLEGNTLASIFKNLETDGQRKTGTGG